MPPAFPYSTVPFYPPSSSTTNIIITVTLELTFSQLALNENFRLSSVSSVEYLQLANISEISLLHLQGEYVLAGQLPVHVDQDGSTKTYSP
jgi:hypothetical protein